MQYRSGDVLRLSPGANNPDGLVSFHKIHSYLRRYSGFGSIKTTYQAYESLDLGGDRLSFKIGLAIASWEIPVICRPALDAVMDLINFTIDSDLEVPVTVKTWTGFQWVRKSGLFQFIPPDDIDSNPWEIRGVKFSYYDLAEIV